MARISRIARDRFTGEVRALFEKFLAERGNIPNMFRTMAHRPELTTTLTSHFRAVIGPGTVPIALKEMLAVRVSRINTCDY